MKKNKWFDVVVSTPMVSIIIVIITIIILCIMMFTLKATMYYVVSTKMFEVAENTYQIEYIPSEDLVININDTTTELSAELYAVEDSNDKCEISLQLDKDLNKLYWNGVVDLKDELIVEEDNYVQVYIKFNLGETYLINILRARLKHEK